MKSIRNSKIKVALTTGDITGFDGDVIVNAANSVMLGGGGVDGAIHRAAGPELARLCKAVRPANDKKLNRGDGSNRCPEGQVVPVPATGDLKCRWVFNTVGPIFHPETFEGVYGDKQNQSQLELERSLYNCLNRSIYTAYMMGQRSVAVPAISTGVYGCPNDVCARVFLGWALRHNDLPMEITFYLYPADRVGDWYKAWETLFEESYV